MIEQGAFDAWGLRTPPAWAQRALEKGIIDESRFQALIRVASEDPAIQRRTPRHRGAAPAGEAHPVLHSLAGGLGPGPASTGISGSGFNPDYSASAGIPADAGFTISPAGRCPSVQ